MKKLGVLSALLVLGAASTASATNGMRMIGFGPAQNAMGGVGVAVGLDSAAMASNPAAMSEVVPQLNLALGYFKPTVSYTATEVTQYPAGGGPGMFVMHDGQKLDSSRGASPIPAFGAVIGLTPDLKLGLGLFAVAGMGVDYGQNLYGGETHTSYMQGRFTPSLSYKINDLISVGATINAMVAQMSYDVAAGFGQQKHDTATSLGLGGVVGLTVTPLPILTLGVAYESKSSFRDFSFDIPAHTGMTPSGPFNFPAGTDKLTFNQPQSVTGGVAVRPFSGSLVIAAELGWINWAQTNGANLPKFSSDTTQTGAMPFNMSWSNQFVYKLGVQVPVLDGLLLRAGYNYGKNPLDTTRAFENVAFPAVAEHHFTVGAQYAVGDKLSISLAAMYSPTTKVSGANMQEQGIAAYETSMSQFQADVGVSYRF